MTETTSFWWQVLRKAADVAYNVGVEIVSDKVREEVEDKLGPVLKLLEDPRANRAFQTAFDKAERQRRYLQRKLRRLHGVYLTGPLLPRNRSFPSPRETGQG
jgi:hypothetical protein